MSKDTKICFTCRKSNSSKFYKIQDCDTDQMSYLEKLKSCVPIDLITNDKMEMCWLCVKHLRISYKFRLTVLTSQAVLKNNQTADLIKKETECEDTKVYGDVNCVKSENDSDTDYCEKNEVYLRHDLLNSDPLDSGKKRVKHTKIKSENSLSCEYCGTLFGKPWQLKKHVARVHHDIRRFVCTYCNKEFKQSNHLKEHITSHTGEKNYSCPICEKKFQRLSSQKRHIKSHDAPPGHKTKRTPFLCTICGKSFPFSNGVQRHMRIHLGIKKFQCTLCSRKFTQSTHLQVHMRTHTGEKPYICDTCGEKFSLKACMLKHINNRHYNTKPFVDELPIFYLHKDFDQN